MKNVFRYAVLNGLLGGLLCVGAFVHPGGFRIVWVWQAVLFGALALMVAGVSLMDEKEKREWLAENPKRGGWKVNPWFDFSLDVGFAMWCAWFGRPFLAAMIVLTALLGHALRSLIRSMREEFGDGAGARGVTTAPTDEGKAPGMGARQ